MQECLVFGKTLPEAYHKALLELADKGAVITCNDYNQKQKEVSMTYVVEDPMSEPLISKLCIGGFYELQQYVMEVLDGILDFKLTGGDAWEYTYHDRIVNYPLGDKRFNQIEFVINELKRTPDSRRAVIDIRDNIVDPFIPHPACLQQIQYFIRDQKLHAKVLMRSNDAPEATFMNAFAFIMLQKSVAEAIGVPVGTYAHRATSFHCYEKDFDLLDSYVKSINTKSLEELTYSYSEFYEELMLDSIPGILEAVERLKGN